VNQSVSRLLSTLTVVTTLAAAGCASTTPEATQLPDTDETSPAAPPPAISPTLTVLPEFDSNGQPLLPGTNRLVERTFYFDLDQAVLDSKALEALRLHAQGLIAHPDQIVIIEGHADERGTRDYNLALGERRADVVRAFLIAAGVTPGQIQTVSYGEEMPEVAGENERAWSQNRRALLNYAATPQQVGTR
jgi:peptidoglycan-associated lipoprotein